jgi:hypothetical protein
VSRHMHDELPRELWDASIAVDRAYAPLRSRTASLSPARVRLALRIPEPVPASVRITRVTSRFAEIALAAAVTAFAFVGSASVAPKPAIVEETSSETSTHPIAAFDDQNFFRWIRIGRYTAPSDLVDASASLSRGQDDTATVTNERAGLAR